MIMLGKLFSTITKEMLEVAHDRTMLAVLVVFPIFIMLFMGSSFRSMEINGLPIGVVGPQNTTFSAMLFSGLNESKAFKLQDFGSESEAMDAFRNGQLKAVIVVPADFEDTLGKGNGSKIRIVVDNSDLALEQSVISAMSSVVQASSADMTKTYVTSAWKQLGELNSSAASLGQELAASRAKMNQTKAKLEAIEDDMKGLNISHLEGALDDAGTAANGLYASMMAQKASLADASLKNQLFMNSTAAMLENASATLNESIASVEDAHAKLLLQITNLTQTSNDLQSSISGLEILKNTTSDATIIAALDLNIASLKSMRNSTQSQILAAQDETQNLESLNATLHGFNGVLSNYSASLALAQSSSDDTAMLLAIDSASSKISAMNSSFASAKTDIAKLKTVMDGIDSAMVEIGGTLDQALAQTDSVDSLLLSLRKTVEDQTSRDPAMIASPLSVDVQNQYVRSSFVDFLIPQVIAVSLLFSCFLLAAISLVREKTRNTMVRALLAPLGLENLVLGKIISLVLLSMGQVLIILMVALLLFGVKPPVDPTMLVAGTGISALVLSSIGILIGFYARTESAAIQTCLLIAIPMLFLGNIIFSPDLLPNYTQILQSLLPLAHVTSIYKIVLITGGNPSGEMTALLSYFVLLAAAMALIMVKRRDISNYA
jgi:ABC-type multidrug transport system permease subunit